MTASLPLNVFATDVQNGTACAWSGIGLRHLASADRQCTGKRPSDQCRSRIATMPLALSRRTYALIAFW